MNEEQTKHDLITPALHEAGWNTMPAHLAFEQTVAPGRVESDGRSHKPEKADYVLMYGSRRIAVVEAKSDEKPVDAGEAQARHYAEALGVRFAYATNGLAVRSFDLVTQTSNDLEFLRFPTPAQLLDLLNACSEESRLEQICREIPWAVTGKGEVRYYQERAVEAVIRALGRGKKNALITLATGTGKTFIAYQLVHKLVSAKWTRKSIGLKKPRILFLADRNILADQAKESFAFPTGECYRLNAATDDPPMDRTVYFTLYQTLLGKGEADELGEADMTGVKYTKFPPDFFDLVIIDECHRGGANDESAWRVVLDYFKSASHVGLTATPKCDVNGSTYAYFGEPVYQYSLKEGIADGFLSPYRVKQCYSTLRGWQYQPGDKVSDLEELDEGKFYSNDELERDRIRIKARDRHFVDELFKVMPPDQKALVFCVTQEHALRIAHLIREKAKALGIVAAHYCERVTADDGAIGEQYLKEFRNSENEVPTILTTSQKLTTGVDACNVRSIVLLKQVKSMVEFKQIIGRGTRLYDGKPYFTIYDFTDATKKFTDPDWDGPVVCPTCGKNPCVCGDRPRTPCKKCGHIPCICPKPPTPPCPKCGCLPCVCEAPQKKPVEVELWDGRMIAAYWKESVFFDSQMLSVKDFLHRFAVTVQKVTQTPELLKSLWQDMNQRRDLLEKFDLAGFDEDKLREIQKNVGKDDCDLLDVMLDIAYSVETVTREFRAQFAGEHIAGLTDERLKLLQVILTNYVKDGVWTLTATGYRDLLLQRYSSVIAAYQKLSFRTTADALAFYSEIQKKIYAA